MPSAGTVTRDGWIETMEPTLLELWTWGLESFDVWKKIWVKKQSNKRREELFEYARPRAVVETPEGAPYVQLTIERVRTAAAIHIDVTGSIRITRQMQRDKQYDEMEEQSWGLGEAMNRKLLDDALLPYQEGFGSYTGADGLSWFNASHVCSKRTSSTWSNTGTAAFSPDAFDDMLTAMSIEKNEHGQITPSDSGSPTIQVIHTPQNRRLVAQTAMKGQYEPRSADFNISTFDIDPICIPQLVQSDQAWANTMWFGRNPRKAKNIYFEREAPSFDSWRDRTNDDVVVTTRAAYSFLVASAHGVHGRNPS